MKSFQTAITAAFLSISAVGAAHAALLDFTDSTGWISKSSPTFDVGEISGKLTADGGSLNFTPFDGTSDDVSSDLYAHDSSDAWDGIGIQDDEIGDTEQLTITFNSSVNVSRIDFLDLFKKTGGAESILVTAFKGENQLHSETFTGNVFEAAGTGYFSGTTAFNGIDRLVFSYLDGNDTSGIGDAALAAVQVSAVPIPAALPLFASALAGLGFVGYRRRRNA
ncbi:VPLPA-CTERM sorting domain-containing protein [Thiorhodovibrio frisius]|uniref:PEP-CTERM exosortase interaction domain-containing protein n=1 Tax=Thiorhodovibrio frisius TaxID=631362 RepID=H8YYA7_9GAMM|nr:VPLPA-CTERM sorting domain-containing protein [Thiorhodovibrio frisius]EIC23433.1 hypothetical protein Thi970DRAFT_01098 [Thiorhodovibrio frisius]WPL23486.1 hypothetical protein Thiofri_03674 [Thiorhodovibrio frisius]